MGIFGASAESGRIIGKVVLDNEVAFAEKISTLGFSVDDVKGARHDAFVNREFGYTLSGPTTSQM